VVIQNLQDSRIDPCATIGGNQKHPLHDDFLPGFPVKLKKPPARFGWWLVDDSFFVSGLHARTHYGGNNNAGNKYRRSNGRRGFADRIVAAVKHGENRVAESSVNMEKAIMPDRITGKSAS